MERKRRNIKRKESARLKVSRNTKGGEGWSAPGVISFVHGGHRVSLTLSKNSFFLSARRYRRTGITEVQPVIPLLLNTAINLARPIPPVQEYPSNPPPIPPPPEKYYASTEICKVSIKNVRQTCDPWRLVVVARGAVFPGEGWWVGINAGHLRLKLCQTPVRDSGILRRHRGRLLELFPSFTSLVQWILLTPYLATLFLISKHYLSKS